MEKTLKHIREVKTLIQTPKTTFKTVKYETSRITITKP